MTPFQNSLLHFSIMFLSAMDFLTVYLLKSEDAILCDYLPIVRNNNDINLVKDKNNF